MLRRPDDHRRDVRGCAPCAIPAAEPDQDRHLMTVAARPASQRRSLSPPAVRPSMRALTSPPPQTRSERRASAHPGKERALRAARRQASDTPSLDRMAQPDQVLRRAPFALGPPLRRDMRRPVRRRPSRVRLSTPGSKLGSLVSAAGRRFPRASRACRTSPQASMISMAGLVIPQPPNPCGRARLSV